METEKGSITRASSPNLKWVTSTLLNGSKIRDNSMWGKPINQHNLNRRIFTALNPIIKVLVKKAINKLFKPTKLHHPISKIKLFLTIKQEKI